MVITARDGVVSITNNSDTDMAHMYTAADSGADSDGNAGSHVDFIVERICCIVFFALTMAATYGSIPNMTCLKLCR